MQIDPGKCVACSNCIPVCPMGAIYVDTGINRATINYDECVECGTCFRGMSQEHLNPTMVRTVRRLAKVFRFRFEPEPDVCPTGAFTMEELEWPRIVRRVFSDPLVEHDSTGIAGRGTEEVKTNDVAHRVDVGEVGYVVEFGRPGTGVRFHQIQTMTMALAKCGVTFEPKESHFAPDDRQERRDVERRPAQRKDPFSDCRDQDPPFGGRKNPVYRDGSIEADRHCRCRGSVDPVRRCRRRHVAGAAASGPGVHVRACQDQYGARADHERSEGGTG